MTRLLRRALFAAVGLFALPVPGVEPVTAGGSDGADSWTGQSSVTIEYCARISPSSCYLQEVLQVLETESVALETTSPSRPGVLRPIGDDS